jgi:hypothetical protein
MYHFLHAWFTVLLKLIAALVFVLMAGAGSRARRLAKKNPSHPTYRG